MVEGTLILQAYFIQYDPYASSYTLKFRKKVMNPKTGKPKKPYLGRRGWVGTWNYELDSVCYFVTLLAEYVSCGRGGESGGAPVPPPSTDLLPPEVLAAARGEAHERELFLFLHNRLNLLPLFERILHLWHTEQGHEVKSKYKYPGLSRDGRGNETAYTGMVFSAFRPSDDATYYGYNVPGNFFLMQSIDSMLRLLKLYERGMKLNEEAF